MLKVKTCFLCLRAQQSGTSQKCYTARQKALITWRWAERLSQDIPALLTPTHRGYVFNPPEEKTHKIEHNDISRKLHKLYQQVVMTSGKGSMALTAYRKSAEMLKEDYQDEWLLALELLELAKPIITLSWQKRLLAIWNELRKIVSLNSPPASTMD
ncbi:MAG: hypothetical protein U5L09_06835 [Bacteroidales bacterium]|nr:hypothetical protein [Bacteroidales bacterium]